MGGGVLMEFKASNRIELSQFIQDLLNCYQFGCNPMGWMAGWAELGGGICTKQKSSKRIELSQLGCDLFDY